MKIRQDDFMCRCSSKGRKRCDEVLAAAREDLRSSLGDKVDDDIWLVDTLLYNLAIDGEVRIIADQWAAVLWAPQRAREKEGGGWELVEAEPGCRIQCDSIVDGLAATYLYSKQLEKGEPIERRQAR